MQTGDSNSRELCLEAGEVSHICVAHPFIANC